MEFWKEYREKYLQKYHKSGYANIDSIDKLTSQEASQSIIFIKSRGIHPNPKGILRRTAEGIPKDLLNEFLEDSLDDYLNKLLMEF